MPDSNPEVITMKEFGEILGTRGIGERVRERIVSLLQSLDARIILDFEGVQVMTQSFGDELFRKLVAQVSQEEVARLGIANVSEDVRAVIRYSLAKTEPAVPKS